MVSLNVLCIFLSKVLADSPMYSSSHSFLPHLNQYMILLCFVMDSLSFGNINRFFKVFPPLKYTWTPYYSILLQKRNTKFIRCRNYPKKHVPMGKAYHSCQKHTPEGSPQQFRLCLQEATFLIILCNSSNRY